MGLGFNVRVTVKSPDGKRETKTLALTSEKNLFAVVKKLFPAMKFKLDSEFGAEVSEIEGLKKSERAGLHFTINGQVPVDMVNGQKLYCALYHVQANKDMDVVLELVSVSCDFAGSILKPMLDYRSRKWALEPLEDMANPRVYKAYIQSPPWQMPDVFLGFYVQQLAFRAGNFGGFSPKLRPREEKLDFRPAFAPRSAGGIAPSIQHNEFFSGHPSQGSVLSESLMPMCGAQSYVSGQPRESMRPYEGKYLREGVGASGWQENFGSGSGKQEGKKLKPIPLSSLADFKAVIFDLDGVVVDSEAAHLRSFNRLLAPFGVKITEKMWCENYTGVGSLAILKDVFARNGIKEDIGVWMAKRAEIYHDVVVKSGLKEISGFSQFFKLLEQNGIRIAVASGGHKPHILASMMSIGMPRVEFVGLEDVKNSKPAPDTFLLAASKLGVSPSQCVVFEDSFAGMKAAASAGMPCVALSTTLPKAAIEGKAALIVNNFASPALRREIRKLIAKKGGKKKEGGKTPGWLYPVKCNAGEGGKQKAAGKRKNEKSARGKPGKKAKAGKKKRAKPKRSRRR